MNNLDIIKELCDGFIMPEPVINFNKLYSFTTENIAGYIDMFDLKDKSLLTVGSSSDQVLNAILKGCVDITLLDICPFSKEFYYLKSSAVKVFTYEEFIDFFYYRGYDNFFNKNIKSFSRNQFNKLREVLKERDYSSFEFWNYLYNYYKPTKIRQRLFTLDNVSLETLSVINPYLKTKEKYNELRNNIKDVQIKFITGDILDFNLENKYDNIFLSNIVDYLSIDEIPKLYYKIRDYLSRDGLMLFFYLFHYKLNKNLNYFMPNLPPDLICNEINGVLNIANNGDSKDAVLIYHK